jgi:hypothetical protein
MTDNHKKYPSKESKGSTADEKETQGLGSDGH